MNINVNYKNKKRYNSAKYPIRQPLIIVWLIWLLSKIMLVGKKYKVEKINMEGLKPPYMLLSNHMYFIDFELATMGTFPYRVNNVMSIGGFYRRPWLIELIGGICTRKFTMDLHLIKSIRKVLKRGDILAMYPEARYSPCGTTSYMPDSLGKLIKMSKVPVVAVVHRGNHLLTPFWNFRKPRKVPLHTTMELILTAEQVAKMSAEEINERVREALQYDDYRYQKENGILITEPYRAEGLHKVLYQCPNCRVESKMDSEGTEIFCRECGKRWNLNEDGTLAALSGETEFSHIPDWYAWQRECVKKEILSGEYKIEREVDIYMMIDTKCVYKVGDGTLTHTKDGFKLVGCDGQLEYTQAPELSYSLYSDFYWYEIGDVISIGTPKVLYYCIPKTKRDIVAKARIAAEEIYKLLKK